MNTPKGILTCLFAIGWPIEIYINVSMGCGDAEAKAWGCDLTYDYVKINGDYRS